MSRGSLRGAFLGALLVAAGTAPSSPAEVPVRNAPAPGPAEATPIRLVTLADALDLALKNNPATRSAWYRARAAKEVVGVREAAYLPTVDGLLVAGRQQQVAQGGNVVTLLSSWGPAAALNWALFDFGYRRADVNEATALAAAASLASDAIVQAVILRVEEAWVQYNAARELVAAAELNLKEARTNLEAAEARKAAGVATIADVLQAKTQMSRALVNLEEASGLVAVQRGTLATSLGVPATTSIDAAPLQGDEVKALRQETEDVSLLVEKALMARPDLKRSDALRQAAEERVASSKGLGLPTVSSFATASRVFYAGAQNAAFGDNWSLGINVRIPIFTGFARLHDIQRATEEAAAARQEVEAVKQQVILDVWVSLQNLKTSERQLAASRDLLEAAIQSMEAASARYKAGVGTIIDLLTAEAALGSARASVVESRAKKMLAMARLAYATGFLTPETPLEPESTKR